MKLPERWMMASVVAAMNALVVGWLTPVLIQPTNSFPYTSLSWETRAFFWVLAVNVGVLTGLAGWRLHPAWAAILSGFDVSLPGWFLSGGTSDLQCPSYCIDNGDTFVFIGIVLAFITGMILAVSRPRGWPRGQAAPQMMDGDA